MKRLCSFLCLLLCVCICFPAFLVSASALVDVDGTYAYLAWWYDNPQDYVSFTNQIVTQRAYKSFIIQVDIDLINPFPKKTYFDIDLGFDFGNCESVTVLKFQPLNSSSVALDNLVASLVDNHLSLTELYYKEDVKYIRVQFEILRPSWISKKVETDITINGTTYKAQQGTTWGEWVSSEYDTLGLFVGEQGIICGDNVQLFNSSGNAVLESDFISTNGVYTLNPIYHGPSFYFMGDYYPFDEGMTWETWITSDYNTLGIYTYTGNFLNPLRLSDGSNFCYLNKTINYLTNEITFNSSDFVTAYAEILPPKVTDPTNENIVSFHFYGTQEFCDSMKNGDLNPLSFGLVNYYYDFEITSVSVVETDDTGFFASIIGWIQKVSEGITQLPQKIGQTIGAKLIELGEWLIEKIKGLFIPSEESIIELKDKFEELLRARFGAVYDSADIIDDFASSFAYTDTDASVSFPEVTVNLVGTDFTFGGWEVDVIPDGFEGIVDSLKFLISIVSTVWFVNALRKRLEDILE